MNGHSSFTILSALHRNGTGRLASIDVREDVGRLVTAALAERWIKIILAGRRPNLEVLRSRLSDLGPVGLFFHDGDHRLIGQLVDYRLAADLLSEDGIVMSDDINTSSAWLEASALGIFPAQQVVLFDLRKAVGFAQRRGPDFPTRFGG